jgi:hypothetical protein
MERMKKICAKHILLSGSKETTSRKKEEVSELRWFNERIKNNTVALKDEQKPKMQKAQLLRQLLQSLQSRGLSYLKSNFAQQRHMAFLFGLPSMHTVSNALAAEHNAYNTISDKSTELDRFMKSHAPEAWHDLNARYYRCIRKMRHLRESAEFPSKEINAKDVRRTSGFVEHLLFMMNEQRQMLASTANGFVELSESVHLLANVNPGEAPSSSTTSNLPSQGVAMDWARKLKVNLIFRTLQEYFLAWLDYDFSQSLQRIVDQVEQTLIQLLVVGEAVQANSKSRQAVNEQLNAIRTQKVMGIAL